MGPTEEEEEEEEYFLLYPSLTTNKASVHKIQSCFMICAVEFVNHSHVTWLQMQQFFPIHAADVDQTGSD
jgi:hypothetical protein